MAMLTLNGVLQNVYSQPERKDEKTGEIRPASLHAQILAENVTQTGKPNWRWSRSRCTRMRSKAGRAESARPCGCLRCKRWHHVLRASQRSAAHGGLKKMPSDSGKSPGRGHYSSALIDNTIDMQSVSRPREKSATGAQISHRTTGPAARSGGGARVIGGPTGAPEGGSPW